MTKFVILFIIGLIYLDHSYCELPELCQLPYKVGDCRAAIPRYFYNNQTNKCEQFSYGGCGGNDNNFLRLEDCQTCCGDSEHKCSCYLPPKVGPCEAAIKRYYYDSSTGECLTFIFGGCQPNSNNFQTIEDCQYTCSKLLV